MIAEMGGDSSSAGHEGVRLVLKEHFRERVTVDF